MDVLKAMKTRLEVAADGVGGTDMEKKVKAATSLENWPATNTQLHELSQATNDYQSYREIMTLLWKRLGEPPRNWRTVYKSLVLLEHLLRYGSPRVIEETRDRAFTLRQLHDFHYREPDTDRDRGSGVRDKSKQIVELLGDARQLDEVRATAKQNLHKFVGVSNNGRVSGAGSMYGGGGGGGGYDDRSFGGGAGAFGSSTGGYDDGYVSRADREKAAAAKSALEGRRSDASASASHSSPYDDADADAGEKKKKKKKKKSAEEDEDDDAPQDPYAEAAAGSVKKKKKSSKASKAAAAADEEQDVEDDASEKKKSKKLKVKMRDASAVSPGAPVAIAAPPGHAGAADEDGFGDFTTAAPTAAASAQPAATQQQSALSFDNFDAFGSGSAAPAAAAATTAAPSRPAAGGDLIDMFASASIDNSGADGWGSSVARNNGPVDFLSAAPAQPQKQAAAPSLFDAAVPASKQKQQQQQRQQQPAAELQLNDHNNADAFSSFVAGHKPAPSSAASKPASGASTASSAAGAPRKSGELAWENSLVDLGSMASNKAPSAGTMAPAPFIAGGSIDPFAGLGGPQRQAQVQGQRPPQQQQQAQMGGGMMGMPQMGGGGMPMGGAMGMGMMGGGMGMGGGGMPMQMGGGQMGMGGMPMGMGGQMGMGMGGMPMQMGGGGGGGGFNSLGFGQQAADPNKIFF